MWINSNEPTDLDTSAESAKEGVEGELREFVRREVAPRRSLEDSEVVANNINAFLQRVAGFSIAAIDRQIAELHTLREVLQSESTRVHREIAEYSHLSQSAIQSIRIITESLAKPKF